jgi:hypothetical protein
MTVRKWEGWVGWVCFCRVFVISMSFLTSLLSGGDIVTGAATVIEAMGAGKKAAAAMHSYLAKGEWK